MSDSRRLIVTLALAGAFSGLLLVSVYGWAQPRIVAHQEAALEDAIMEVLGQPAGYRTLWIVGDRVVDDLPAGADSAAHVRVFLGTARDGQSPGWAILGARPGFQDVIRLIFGYDAATNTVLGMRVLESKETPGLGDKIEKDTSFTGGFVGARAPVAGVKAGAAKGTPEEVDMITGATISSRAVIDIINERTAALDGLLDAYAAGGLP